MLDKYGKVLVAGGGGFIGSHLVKALSDLGLDVRATLFSKKPEIDMMEDVEYVYADLTDALECYQVCKDVKCVFMCAAYTTGAVVTEKSPLDHVTPNVIMNAQMINAAYQSGVEKYVFISSSTVYPDVDFPVKEEDLNCGPLFDKYFCVGSMKRFGETLCEMYSTKVKKPMSTLIIRPGNAYGPGDNFDYETCHVLPALIRRAVERKDPYVVWGTGEDVKDFVYIQDLIDGILIATDYIKDFRAINIAHGTSYSVNDVLKLILKHADYEDANVVYDKSKPIMINARRVSMCLAKDLIGFEPQITIDRGIYETVRWYKENRWEGS